ncbi:LIM and calponin homology domains-containing protein 1-like isoform X3 [Poeciliopsis prolifica]|uniref:LIM and calponin homology domains-containing protein 1-like isoform X3 n=1 Tax=Poeciliopsis prolifica TaxID=188132 RepID=UPI0024135A04|nr:LIM and calponin homology domains-containing protein 1-like isoform X3 [Poeciliopsis prolifica]XP_054886563.1 LIM and calponin homology domains-containing protein 1-like isoform X3 [Poeciliopsis prolifica]
MASPVADLGQSHQHHPVSEWAADSAFLEAQKWIEAATGRCFGDKDFRGGLENGILLCELLSSIRPGLVKKINRLPTPIAGLDNLSVFLRGCEELGLKGSQLFDPGDLQDTSTRPAAKGSDCSRRLKNVLITIYWLGRAANSCTSYNGPTLDLKEFEGLLSQMRKEAEVAESPQRSIRDSGYIDCWDSERSDSLSPPRHGREDSFDSLDSFGSRSQQTPSPDVLVPRGSSDGRGSDSESDGTPNRKMPDLHKDDMLARRTSVTELRTAMPFNQYLPNRSNQSGYVPAPLRKKKNEKEEGGHKSWSTATSPVGGGRPCSIPARSCSEELFQYLAAVSPSATSRTGKRPTATDQEDAGCAAAAGATDAGGLKGRSDGEEAKEEKSCLGRCLPATSLSMIDMRGENEAILQPHSHIRHELMHNQYNRIKEDENHWQEDLARWKSRRRSVSQDLIKKEEERKMMEQLMSGDRCISQRRKSIKTYREIVEDKERREEELRDAYRKARTPEEASAILQRYAQRFSISEAVLERLQLPKLLDRSLSADPSFSTSPFSLSLSSSPTTPDPFDEAPEGPLRYLRQQSAPAPRFTSTLEAQIEEFPKDSSSHQRPQIRSRSSEPPSTRALSPKPVPLLTPKPYFQPQLSSNENWNGKADGLLRVNGDIRNDASSMKSESKERDSPPLFQASPDAPPSDASPTRDPPASPERGSPVLTKTSSRQSNMEATSVTEGSPTPTRPTSLPEELKQPEDSFVETGGQKEAVQQEEKSTTAAQKAPSTESKSEKILPTEINTPNDPAVTSTGEETEMNSAAPVSLGHNPLRETSSEFEISVRSPQSSSNPKSRWEFFAPPEAAEKDRDGNVSVPVLAKARRGDRWSWDPDEERKRQERWQQEQERMLQEKYQREQEKLKEEWEKAQREVAEEERKYHEEERRILEETVMPLTPRSSALPSPSRGGLSSTSEPQDTIVRSLADWERKQELLERQSRGSTESAEWKRKENDRTSDISTADDSMKTGRSLVSQNSSEAERLGHSVHNGQKLPPPSPKCSTPPKKQSGPEGTRTSRPAGERRCGPTDNNVRSSSKSLAACPSAPDTFPPPPNRSVSGKKLCSSCSQPLGKGAAMIIETLSLYFHIHCFKCGVCKGQLGDTTTGTDVRIRNGLLNCNQCYIRSRSAGQPTTL